MTPQTNNEMAEMIQDRCTALGWSDVSVVILEPMDWSDLARLLEDNCIESLIVLNEGCMVPAGELYRVGVYYPDKNGWLLPRHMSPHLLILGELELSGRMAMRAYLAGVREIATASDGEPRKLNTIILSNGARAARRIFSASSNTKNQKFDQRFPDDQRAILPPSAFDPNRVLMINSALAWGGAERQLVNTMIGLHERGRDVQLVCEALNYVPDSDFFKWRLDQRGLSADMIRKDPAAFQDKLDHDLIDAALSRAHALPSPFKDLIAPYILEMLARRPGIVHAWQDQTNILAGAAAIIAGVPKVILSTRNVSPRNFAYYQQHMPDSYRGLTHHPYVRIINNSKAGAADYCNWLGEGADKFDLVYNGLDFTDMKTPTQEESRAFRNRLGVAGTKKLLGSIFRLYEEKDPFLWLETAMLVGERLPDVDFVIFGAGPLRDQLLDKMDAAGMRGRLHLPGTEKNPALALSIMDAFLLTSKFEGLPNVIIEAQSQGVPVVTTRAGGSGEAILPEKTGWVVDERTSEKLAEMVCKILTDDIWRAEAAALAPEFAQSRFGFDRMIDETLAIYDRTPPRR